jgi:hypothetical protein
MDMKIGLLERRLVVDLFDELVICQSRELLLLFEKIFEMILPMLRVCEQANLSLDLVAIPLRQQMLSYAFTALCFGQMLKLVKAHY